MTVDQRRPGAAVAEARRPRHPDHRRLRGQRAQGHAGHPGRRAARHPDPAVLRPPAARPGRRLPPVPGRGRGPAQAARLLHHRRSPTAWSSRPSSPRRSPTRRSSGVMELLLINHPLDCPVCDKGGECPLQNQAMSNGRGESRFDDVKRTFPKPIAISSQVLLDRERCVLCARCTRFSAADRRRPVHRAARARRAAAGRHLRGRAVPVLLLRQHRADLPGRRAHRRGLPVPGPAVRPGLHARASASTARPAARMRTDHRRGKVLRRLAGDDPQVNEEWNCDKGRWAFHYATAQDRLTTPLVRDDDGELRADVLGRGARHRGPRAWPRPGGAAGVLVGGRRPSRTPTPTPSSPGSRSAPTTSTSGPGRTRPRRRPSSPRTSPGRGLGRDLRRPRAGRVGAARRARARGGVADPLPAAAQGRAARACAVHAVAPFASRGLDEARPARCSPAAPGQPRPQVARRGCGDADAATLLRRRARSSSSASGSRRCPARCPRSSGWPRPPAPGSPGCPRRAGERGAVEAGALPDLLPGGRPVGRRRGPGRRRHRLGRRPRCPARAGRDTDGDPRRGCTPASSARCSSAASTRPTCPTRPPPWRRSTPRRSWSASSCARRAVTERADVVLPGRAGRRRRPAPSSTGRAAPARSPRCCAAPTRCPTSGCCTCSPRRWASTSACPTSPAARAEIAELGLWDGDRAALRSRSPRPRRRRRPPARPSWPPGPSCSTPAGCRTASRTWPAPPAPPVARVSAATAAGARRRRRRRRSPCRTDRGCGHAAGASSPRCPTAWSGCRPTPPALPVRRDAGAARVAVRVAAASGEIEREVPA